MAAPSGTEAARGRREPPDEFAPLRRPEGAIPLEDLLTPILRQWRLVAVFALAGGLLAAVTSLIVPPVYTAQTTFSPVASSHSVAGGLSSLVGLAGQLGLSGLTSSGSLPPEYFAEVLRSRSILESTLKSKFPADSAAAERPLLDILKVDGPSERARLEQGTRALDGLVLASVDKRTGVINLRVRSHSPVLAAGIANRMVQLLNEFNLDRRQVQSREQRRFTGERVAQAQEELRGSERALLRFLEANREYHGSPVLEYQASKLQRDVQVRQEVYLTLAKAYEEARIAEVRDIPVLTVIDEAVPPVLRSSPRRKLNTLLGLFLGGAVGIAAAFLYQARRHRRAQGDFHHPG